MAEKQFMYTYLMKSIDLYKIGQSRNPESRIKSLRVGNPHIELICYGRKYSEKQMHRKFKRLRVVGEWFRLSELDVRWLQSNIDDKVLITMQNVDAFEYNYIPQNVREYIIEFGRYKRKPIIELRSKDAIEYCMYVWKANKNDKSGYKYRIFRWWYYYMTKQVDEFNYDK